MLEGASIKQLMNDEKIDMRRIFTHSDLIFTIKNQDPIIKHIFTPPNTHLLLSFLNEEHPLEPTQKDLCYKIPSAAMEILCCESHLLTDIIFQSELDDQEVDEASQDTKYKHMLEFLFNFFDYQQHYFLAGLFTKAVSSLTKRVFPPSHKYNQLFCNKIFAKDNGYLFKTFNHMYSQSMNELIVRWLTLKSKECSFKAVKEQYLSKIFSLINLSEGELPPFQVRNFGEQSLESACNLVLLLLKQPQQPPSRTQPQLNDKNINLLINKNSQKQLYELCCQTEFISEILKPIPNPRIQKLNLIKKLIQQYRTQIEKADKTQEMNLDLHLSHVINQQMLVQCLGWVNQVLVSASYQAGQKIKTNQSANNPTQASDKASCKYIIAYLELLYQFHSILGQLREPLTFFYESRQKQHVEVIVRLLRLKNNIIHNLLSKIIMKVLKDLDCPDFFTALLHFGIAQVIDEERIREHVVPWAKIILERRKQKEHIFQNPTEESKWDHMTEIVAAAEDIIMGKFRFQPSNLMNFYSAEKAKQFYHTFLGEPIVVQYEEKQGGKKTESQAAEQSNDKQVENLSTGVLKKKRSCPPVIQVNGNTVEAEVDVSIRQVAEPQQMDILGLDSIRQGYLSYDVEQIMKQIQMM